MKLPVVMVVNSAMYANEDIHSNWYNPCYQKEIGLDDKSQNLMKISLNVIIIFPIGVQRIYKWPMWLNFDFKLI